MPKLKRAYRSVRRDAFSCCGFSNIFIDDVSDDFRHESLFDEWRGDGQTGAENSEEG